MFRCFATCLPGFEEIVAAELAAFETNVVPGGVEFRAAFPELVAVCTSLRIAATVLIRIATFDAHNFSEFENGVGKLPWNTWLYANDEYAVRVHASKSALYHTGAVEERLRKSIAARIPKTHLREQVSDVARVIHVRLERDECTISFDAAGEPLYRRGYRQNRTRAPLREDVARVLVREALQTFREKRSDAPSLVLDPMCGSGTLLIEAAEELRRCNFNGMRMFALNAAPLAAKHPLRATDDVTASDATTRFVGSDNDTNAIEAAKENAQRARAVIELQSHDAFSLPRMQPDIVLLNPPWGTRLEAGLKGVSRWLDDTYPNSVVGIALPSDHNLPKHYVSKHVTKMGGISAQLVIRAARHGARSGTPFGTPT